MASITMLAQRAVQQSIRRRESLIRTSPLPVISICIHWRPSRIDLTPSSSCRAGTVAFETGIDRSVRPYFNDDCAKPAFSDTVWPCRVFPSIVSSTTF